jgi:hypothetical protein
MTGTPLDLLPLVRAGAGLLSGARAKAAPAHAEGESFADLLKKAESGQLSSGREVTIGEGVDVKLGREQLAGLAAAADRAEASGALNVMVLIDGMALKLDVQNRSITAKADLAAGQVLTGVDAVVSIPGAGHSARAGEAAPPVLPYPGGSGGLNPSLARTLAARS